VLKRKEERELILFGLGRMFVGEEERKKTDVWIFQFLSHMHRRLKKVTYALEIYDFTLVFEKKTKAKFTPTSRKLPLQDENIETDY